MVLYVCGVADWWCVHSACSPGQSDLSRSTSTASDISRSTIASSVNDSMVSLRSLEDDKDFEIESDMPPLENVIPKDILKKLKPKEKKRQEVINGRFKVYDFSLQSFTFKIVCKELGQVKMCNVALICVQSSSTRKPTMFAICVFFRKCSTSPCQSRSIPTGCLNLSFLTLTMFTDCMVR
jgi:hypothetical protein